MAYQRGTVSSYNQWAKLVGDDTYSWKNLLPYFKKSMTFTPADVDQRGGPAVPYDKAAFSPSGGPLHVSYWNYFAPVSSAVLKGLQSLGFKESTSKIQSGSLLGYTQFPATMNPHTQTRDSSQTSFLNDAIKANTAGKLQVYTYTLAKRILFNGKKAVGVSVVTSKGSGTATPAEQDTAEYVLTARREVILAAGVFRTPQLLMASGIGAQDVLNRFNIPTVARLEGVGKNIMVRLSRST